MHFNCTKYGPGFFEFFFRAMKIRPKKLKGSVITFDDRKSVRTFLIASQYFANRQINIIAKDSKK